jgi:hypothetical protein
MGSGKREKPDTLGQWGHIARLGEFQSAETG